MKHKRKETNNQGDEVIMPIMLNRRTITREANGNINSVNLGAAPIRHKKNV